MNPLMDQQRAQFAREAVRRIVDERCARDPAGKWRQASAFERRCSSFPSEVRVLGFGHAVARLQAEARAPVEEERDSGLAASWLYEALQCWLTQEGQPYEGKPDLLQAILDGAMEAYMSAQIEAFEIAEWLKTLSRALLPDPPADANDGANRVADRQGQRG